jgi:hypothetical protein
VLHRAATVIFGATREAQPWADQRNYHGQLRAMICALRPHVACSADAMLYVFRNRARMRYPKFHTQGWCTPPASLKPVAK